MIGIDPDAQKLSLGLKPSYFEGEEEGLEDADAADADLEEDTLEAAAEMESDNEDMEPGQTSSIRLNVKYGCLHLLSPVPLFALHSTINSR